MAIFIKVVDKTGKDFVDLHSHIFAESRKINLVNEINDALATDVISQLEYLDSIADSDIKMYINSPGGAVSSGLAIIDAMNRCRSDIVTISTGIAASMGALIASCGCKGKRFITPNAEMMIHQPLGGAIGQASDIERQAAYIVQTKRRITDIFIQTTGQSVEKITADCDRDYYMSAIEAVEYGLVDEVLESTI